MSYLRVDTSGLKPLIRRIDPANKKMVHALVMQIKKDTLPYVPRQTGSMSQRGMHMSEGTRVNGSSIIYPGPYARYLYVGKVMVGPLHGPKHATNKDLNISKSAHKKATAHWFEASKKDNLEKWEKVSKKEFLKYVKK